MSESNSTIDLARRIRVHALRMVHKSGASHIGSCLSSVDILAVLYSNVMRIAPKSPVMLDRDRFVLSKGHGAAAVYAVLAESGFFPKEWLETYCQNEGKLPGHITSHGIPGVEVSTGSLGHGLPIGCGMALAGKQDGLSNRIFVLVSDGECDEGSTWEAALFAGHHCLDNLIVIVDHNKLQAFGAVDNVLSLEPLADKWKAFNWAVREIDGHNYGQIEDALTDVPFQAHRPSCIVAHTVKGKGVSFMENQLSWHYKSPDDEQLRRALAELGEKD